MLNTKFKQALAATTLVAAATTANATPITYDPSLDSGTTTNINFDGGKFVDFHSQGFEQDGYTLTGDSIFGDTAVLEWGGSLIGGHMLGSITIDHDDSFSVDSMDLFSMFSRKGNAGLSLLLDDGTVENFVLDLTRATTSFNEMSGFDNVDTATLFGNNFFGLDALQLSQTNDNEQAVDVPEPGTLGLFLLGGLGLAGMRRKFG